MNKVEKLIVALLFVLLVGWGFFQRMLSPAAAPPTTSGETSTNLVAGATGDVAQVAISVPATNAVPSPAPSPAPAPTPAPVVDVPTPDRGPEQTLQLSNDELAVTLSSWGGGITSAKLLSYPSELDNESERVTLDFEARPALSLAGVPGLSSDSEFDIRRDANGTGAVLRASADDLQLERRVSLGDGFRLTVTDTFRNAGSAPAILPRHGLSIGPMRAIQTRARSRGYSYLGVDTLPDLAGRDVTHWGKKKIPEFFGRRSGIGGCTRSNAQAMPPEIRRSVGEAVTWAAAKNKFFVQILCPDETADDCEIYASRNTNSVSALKLDVVSAALTFEEKALAPGESITRTARYYVGPKKYSALKPLGQRQSDVMQFGWWAWFRGACVILLTTLNAIHSVLPNYGVAIILLTIIVKILFWPLTHKGTESAKKMQAIKPLVDELREKHKDQPQKMQQAQMALYREHGVNPMASCLPMLVQLPIFIALFTVLRSAVELRFAPFLWIADLSEPEGLLAGVLPFPRGGLNILPILMTVTMVFQQRLTPTAGDPQQQKMMMFMPMIMLVFFYNMPSALVLYWTVSQSLSIAQLMWQKKGAAKTAEA